MIIIAGLQPPILRSSLSVFVTTFGLVFLGRGLNIYRALVYCALILLWIFSNYILSYSFWLSFAATFGLVTFGDHSAEVVEIEWFQNFKSLVRNCIGTFLYTLPLIANLAGGVSILEIAANIVLIPIIPFLTLDNLFALVPIVGELPGFVAMVLQNMLIILVQDLAKYSLIIPVAKFGLLEIGLYWLVLGICVKSMDFLISRIGQNN